MIEYKPYQKTETKFLKLSEAIPNTGDEIRMKLVDGKIEPGYKGNTELKMDVICQIDNEQVRKTLTCRAPDENYPQGSQVYRGMVDNNIQPDDVFIIANGGKMDNEYKTQIHNVMKDETRPAPEEEEVNMNEIKDMF